MHTPCSNTLLATRSWRVLIPAYTPIRQERHEPDNAIMNQAVDKSFACSFWWKQGNQPSAGQMDRAAPNMQNVSVIVSPRWAAYIVTRKRSRCLQNASRMRVCLPPLVASYAFRSPALPHAWRGRTEWWARTAKSCLPLEAGGCWFLQIPRTTAIRQERQELDDIVLPKTTRHAGALCGCRLSSLNSLRLWST